MKIKNTRYFLPVFFSLISCFTILFSCNDEFDLNKENSGGAQTGILHAEVSFDEGFVEPGTRTPVSPWDGWTIGNDRGTYTFTNGDTMGIFTRSGNLNIPGGGPLINVPMAFVRTALDPTSTNTSTILENPDYEIYTGGMSPNEVFMYYPYTPKMGKLSNYNPKNGYMEYGQKYNEETGEMEIDNDPNTPWGVELRKKAPDGTLRCIDFIISYAANATNLKKGVITGTVYHAFSELIILRGEGFDKPKNDKGETDYTINVVVTNPATHVRITSYNPFVTGSSTEHEMVRWNNQIYWDENYTVDGKKFSREDAQRWEAWRGADKINNADNLEYPAWYVVLPRSYHAMNNVNTYGSQNSPATSISYIELWDNDGYKQKVTSINLLSSPNDNVGTKTPAMRYRYTIIIETDEMGAVANPVSIKGWEYDDEGNDLTETRAAGIASEIDYNIWASNYNGYISTNDDNARKVYEENLFTYGNLVNGKWEFLVTKEIDFKNTAPIMVNVLQDKISGANNFVNITLKNINIKYPLFNEIIEGGQIENIDFKDITVNAPAPTAEENSEGELVTPEPLPVGCIARYINRRGNGGAIFKNCNIKNGTVVNQGKGPVGIFAGSMNFGSIEDSSFSGIIIGGSTAEGAYENIFGITPPSNEAPGLEEIDCNVIFTQN